MIMTRKITLALVLIAATGMATAQPVNSDLVNPGQKPGDLFYPFERFSESLEVGFAKMVGGNELAAKARANNAEERLSEARALTDQNRSEKVGQLMQEYHRDMNRSTNVLGNSNDTGAKKKLQNVTSRHVKVLQDVERKVPGPAKKGVQNAIDNSQKNQRFLERKTRTGPPVKPGIERPGNSDREIPATKNQNKLPDEGPDTGELDRDLKDRIENKTDKDLGERPDRNITEGELGEDLPGTGNVSGLKEELENDSNSSGIGTPTGEFDAKPSPDREFRNPLEQ